MSQIDQVQELMALAAPSSQVDLSPLVEALASQLNGQAMQAVGEAYQAIASAGADPSMFIAKPRSVLRQEQAALNAELLRNRENQRLRHEEELHELEMRQRRAEVSLSESTAERINAS